MLEFLAEMVLGLFFDVGIDFFVGDSLRFDKRPKREARKGIGLI
jgi:hypothetical protein